MGMGWRAAGPVMWKQEAGRGGRQPTAEESKDKKGQRLDSVFFLKKKAKKKQATMSNAACRFCVTLFFFFPS